MKKILNNKTTRTNLVTYLVVIVAFILMQVANSIGMLGSSMKGLLVPICVYISLAVSLNLLVGICGELSLGHAGFMGIGAFSGIILAALLNNVVSNDFLRLLLAMLCGGVLAGIVGFLIGVPVLRLRGDYLAIVTLAFGEIIKSIVTNLYVGVDANGLHMNFLNPDLKMQGGKMIMNGPMGMTGIAKISTFFAGFLLIMVTLMIIFNLVNSRSGRAIMALRDNRIAAESVGINVTKYKLMAFVISAALAGAAGTLFGLCQNTVMATKFDFNTSILVLVFVVLGGLGRMWGSIIAAAALTILPELLREFSEYRMLIYAIVLILVMLATNNPTIKGFFARIFKRKGAKKE